MRGVREALQQGLLHIHVVGERHEGLARLEEVGYPGERRRQLAAPREAAQMVELHEPLVAERRGDLGLE